MQSISNPFHSGDEQIDDIMEKMKISETDVARAVHGMYKHEFVCVDPKRNRYYHPCTIVIVKSMVVSY